MDLNKLLTNDELEAFSRHMELRNAEGQVVVTADDMVRRMLHILVTKTGSKNANDGVHVSRGTILPMLIAALVNEHPEPEAWIEAIAVGRFDVSVEKRYAQPRSQGVELGSPGNYLPRLLQRYKAAAGGSDRLSKMAAARLGTALRLLIATALLRELKKATNSHAALGSAWPLIHAVSSRPQAKLRRLIAQHGDNTKFIAHLASAIEVAVAEWIGRLGTGDLTLTNPQVDSQVPSGVDTDAIFGRQMSADKRREQGLIEFGRLMLRGGDDSDEINCRALATLSEEPQFANWREMMTGGTPPGARYLKEGAVRLDPATAERHHRRLRFLMPVAAGPATLGQVQGRALGAAKLILSDFKIVVLGIKLADHVTDDVARGVFHYAREIGPPPPSVALEHLGWFEASACYHSLCSNWRARDAWRAAGLMPCEADSKASDRVNRWIADLMAHTTLSGDLGLGLGLGR